MNLYIMRHGETHWNKRKLVQGSSDIDLTESGKAAARLTAEGLWNDGVRFQRIYTSPYIRASHTAEIINERQKADIISDARLKEMGFGFYEGKSIDTMFENDENLRNCFSVPSLYVPDPTAESFQSVMDRTGNFMESELKPLEPSMDDVLIVCHGAVIRTFLVMIKNLQIDDFWTIHQPNCSVNLVSLVDGQFLSVKENILYDPVKDISKRGIL